MQEQHPEQVVTISWNLDHEDSGKPPSDELKAAVLKELTSLNVISHNVIAVEPTEEVLAHFDIFGLPATLVYGRDGKLVKRFEGSFTYEEDVVPQVEQLLRD